MASVFKDIVWVSNAIKLAGFFPLFYSVWLVWWRERGACPDTRLKKPGNWFFALVFHHPLTLGSLLCVEMFGPKVRALFFWSRGLRGWCRRSAVSSSFPWLSLGILFFFFVFLPFIIAQILWNRWWFRLVNELIFLYLNLNNSQKAKAELLPHFNQYESRTWIMIIKKKKMKCLGYVTRLVQGLCFSLELSTVCI